MALFSGYTPSEGTVLAYSAAGSTYTDLGNVVNVTPPGGERAAVSTTVLGSAHKTYRPGLIRGMPEITFTLQWDINGTQDVVIRSMIEDATASKVIYFWRVTYNDNGTTKAKDIFNGFVTKFEPDNSEDEKNNMANVTIQPTGWYTPTAGA